MTSLDPEYLTSFAALERSIRALPRHSMSVPPPEAPDPAVLAAWLEPYRAWPIPALYVQFLRRYGGVRASIPATEGGLRPLTDLVAYRARRQAIGETFRTRIVLLSHGGIDGNLYLVLSEPDNKARVGLVYSDKHIVYESDSFGLYLWWQFYYLCTVYSARHRDQITVRGVPAGEVEAFNLRLPSRLKAEGFAVLGADSRVICCERDGVSMALCARDSSIGVYFGGDASGASVAKACADLHSVLDANRS